jgi:hypothetical protein
MLNPLPVGVLSVLAATSTTMAAGAEITSDRMTYCRGPGGIDTEQTPEDGRWVEDGDVLHVGMSGERYHSWTAFDSTTNEPLTEDLDQWLLIYGGVATGGIEHPNTTDGADSFADASVAFTTESAFQWHIEYAMDVEHWGGGEVTTETYASFRRDGEECAEFWEGQIGELKEMSIEGEREGTMPAGTYEFVVSARVTNSDNCHHEDGPFGAYYDSSVRLRIRIPSEIDDTHDDGPWKDPWTTVHDLIREPRWDWPPPKVEKLPMPGPRPTHKLDLDQDGAVTGADFALAVQKAVAWSLQVHRKGSRTSPNSKRP